MLISLYLMQSKYIKMHLQEIPSIGVLEFFCAPLYTDNLSDFHKKIQVEYTYDTNVKHESWRFCYNIYFSYDDNSL